MSLTPSQQKVITALNDAGEVIAAAEAKKAYESGKTYTAGRKLSTRIKKLVADANYWTRFAQKEKSHG